MGRPNKREEYIGATYDTIGGLAKVVDYKNFKEVLIEYEDGARLIVQMGNLQRGICDNPNRRTVYNVGYSGQGDYSCKTHPLHYRRWSHMLTRCYSEKYQNKKPSYLGCTVCEEWHNFQNFAKWFEENYYEIDGTIVEVDKDILFKGNKIYSPQTCCLVPREINNIFKENCFHRMTNGVQQFRNKYRVRFGQKHLGMYESFEDASKVYIDFKMNYLRELIQTFNEVLPNNVKQALNSYLEVNPNG